jgi:AraC family transcriptional regulator
VKIGSEQLNRITKAVNFINENPSEDLSLQRLAGLANYSSFHFQKLFRSVIGETPKQYILRIRLETAAHEIVMFLQKSITEIAFDSGFSSSATFSRAFRSHFGISPQELKLIPHEERYTVFRRGVLGRHLLDTDKYFFDPANQEFDSGNPLNIRVTRSDAKRGIFVSCSLDDLSGIADSLRKISQLADVHDLTTDRTKILGALYPHQKLYQAVATIDPDQPVPRKLSEKEIPGGKFAVITITGSLDKTFAAMREFASTWLPSSGYRIADIFGFEVFSTDPTLSPYEEIERDLYIRIEPA